MISIADVKKIEFGDIGERISEHLGMVFNTSGSWNAPKDGNSFDMTIKHNQYSEYYRGESSYLVFFYANKLDMPAWKMEPIKTAEQLRALGSIPDKRYPQHIELPLMRCIEFLYWQGEIPDGDYVCVHKW